MFKSRIMRRAGHAVRMAENMYRIFIENSEGNRSVPRGGDLRITLRRSSTYIV
jgi:hypothetical protein